MSGSLPELYVFAISHYCEKARWALDYLGIDYRLRQVAPGEHRQLARKLGASGSSVPYLRVNGEVIQGSAKIIDWADEHPGESSRRLTPDDARDTCLAIEKRIDDVAGVHIRRYYYSEALVQYPDTVRDVFTRYLPLSKKLLLTLFWGKVRELMIAGMDLGTTQGQASKAITEHELDWVDNLLGDGRRFLVGNALSRADIAVASLLAPLVLSSQHPTYRNVRHPPGMAQDAAGWQHRPSIRWVRDLYADYRWRAISY
jgi:glutathione S-transferase